MSTIFWYITVRGTPRVSAFADAFFLLGYSHCDKTLQKYYLLTIITIQKITILCLSRLTENFK